MFGKKKIEAVSVLDPVSYTHLRAHEPAAKLVGSEMCIRDSIRSAQLYAPGAAQDQLYSSGKYHLAAGESFAGLRRGLCGYNQGGHCPGGVCAYGQSGPV